MEAWRLVQGEVNAKRDVTDSDDGRPDNGDTPATRGSPSSCIPDPVTAAAVAQYRRNERAWRWEGPIVKSSGNALLPASNKTTKGGGGEEGNAAASSGAATIPTSNSRNSNVMAGAAGAAMLIRRVSSPGRITIPAVVIPASTVDPLVEATANTHAYRSKGVDFKFGWKGADVDKRPLACVQQDIGLP